MIRIRKSDLKSEKNKMDYSKCVELGRHNVGEARMSPRRIDT